MTLKFLKIVILSLILPVFIFAELNQEQTGKRQRVDIPNGDRLHLYLMPYLGHFDRDTLFPLLRETYDVNIGKNFIDYAANFEDDSNLKKIIFFEHARSNPQRPYPKSKSVLFRLEVHKFRPSNYDSFSAVYTLDDDLVDGVKFFKYFYPCLLPMLPLFPAFEDKKLCTMVASNWTSDRIKIVEFFETKPLGDFEFYGHFRYGKAKELGASKMYQGPIPGTFSSSDKLGILANYRFSICFENRHNVRGYISEKIFHCFAAGCVPIYWGPENVEDYIPKTCFIDYRDFQSDEELYQFIKNMPKKTYERYIRNIRQFLQSPQAHLFSPEYFDQLLLEAASR